jgi:hypothetical protein
VKLHEVSVEVNPNMVNPITHVFGPQPGAYEFVMSFVVEMTA